MLEFTNVELMAIIQQARENVFNAGRAKDELLSINPDLVALPQERVEAITNYKKAWTQVYDKAVAIRRER